MSEEKKDQEDVQKTKDTETKATKDPTELFAEIYTEVAKLIGTGDMKLMSANRLVESIAETTGICPPINMAVEKCTKMYMTITMDYLAEGKKPDFVAKAARMAYCLAMPPLSGADSISDFIACVTHGMLLGAIPGSDATRLLYAAQVAHSAIPKNRKNLAKILQKRARKEAETSSKSTTSTGIN